MKIKRSKLDRLKTKLAAKGAEMNACELFDLIMDIKDEEAKIELNKKLENKKAQKLATKKYLAKKYELNKKKKTTALKERDNEYGAWVKAHNSKLNQKENDIGRESWDRFFRLVQDPISKKWVDPEISKNKNRKKRPYFRKNS